MKLNPLLAVLCLSLIFKLQAQPSCGFDELHRKKLTENPKYKENIAANEKSIASYIEKNKKRLYSKLTTSSTALFKIPVVVHVVHTGGAIGTIYNPSDVQIEGAINYLNQVYNGSCPGTQGAGDLQIQFVLAQRDPNCNATSGIDRIDGSSIPNYVSAGVNAATTLGTNEINVKNLIRWSPSEYYNIWVVNKIDGKDGTSGSFIAGFAYFPGIEPAYDGTIMLATQMKAGQKTLPHEIGHSLGVYHPFEGSSGSTCPANSSPATEGDMVSDTDPITQPVGFVCRTGINSCTGTAYNDNTESNYMNYTNCYNLFTFGQKARMQAAASSIFKQSLIASPALIGTNVLSSYRLPKSTACTPSTQSTGLSGTYAGIININLNNNNRYSSSVDVDGGYVNSTNDCIKLIPLTEGATYTFSATVYAAYVEQLRAWIDFNNDGSFDNSTEQIHFNSSIPNHPTDFVTTSGTFPIPTTAVLNIPLRMRVIDEVSTIYTGVPTISSGCYSPKYGQAEDYAVYISPKSLPITLKDFNALLQRNQIQLKWSTSLENNASHFDVEKSTDGTTFSKIGLVKASGYSAYLTEYSFPDYKIQTQNFYRLKMVDIDGRQVYSKTILIKPNSDIAQNVWVLSSSFNQAIDLAFAKNAGHVHLQLINSNGELIDQNEVTKPSTLLHWSIRNSLASGIYILKVVVDSDVYTFKLIRN